MKKFFTLLLLFPALIFAQTSHNVAVFGGGTGNPPPSYDPQFITIDVGDTVIWTNTQGKHNVYGELDIFPNNPEGFSSGVPAFAPWTFSHVFTIPGQYGYHCTQSSHSQTQFGTITVVATPGVQEEAPFSEVKLFPVPAKEFLNVELGELPAERFEIIQADGRIVREVRPTTTALHPIDLKGLRAGQYMLRIIGENGETGTIGFVKE